MAYNNPCIGHQMQLRKSMFVMFYEEYENKKTKPEV